MQGLHTHVKYCRMLRLIIGRINNKRTKKFTQQIAVFITNTDHGSAPIFRAIYDNGRLLRYTRLKTVWYFFTFPVAAAAVIKGLAVESMTIIATISWTKITV